MCKNQDGSDQGSTQYKLTQNAKFCANVTDNSHLHRCDVIQEDGTQCLTCNSDTAMVIISSKPNCVVVEAGYVIDKCVAYEISGV